MPTPWVTPAEQAYARSDLFERRRTLMPAVGGLPDGLDSWPISGIWRRGLGEVDDAEPHMRTSYGVLVVPHLVISHSGLRTYLARARVRTVGGGQNGEGRGHRVTTPRMPSGPAYHGRFTTTVGPRSRRSWAPETLTGPVSRGDLRSLGFWRRCWWRAARAAFFLRFHDGSRSER